MRYYRHYLKVDYGLPIPTYYIFIWNYILYASNINAYAFLIVYHLQTFFWKMITSDISNYLIKTIINNLFCLKSNNII